MRRVFVFSIAFALLANAAPRKPKLVVAVVLDQFRYDYLTRFRSEYQGGLARLLNQGAVFSGAHYQHVPSLTAPGHSTILTGATPAISGIVSNDWYDRDAKAHVTSVSDPNTQLLGGTASAGSSPGRLLVSTLGDELKMAGAGKSRVIGISLKDRSAILPSGHMADAAYWYDNLSGNFVSSTYYLKALPDWVTAFNAQHFAEKYRATTWMGHKLPSDGTLYKELEYTPAGNELVERFVLQALAAERLGTGEATDILTVSFSSTDYVGHRYGPDSPEVRETLLGADKMLGELLAAVEAQAGPGNYIVVFTSDHGVAPAAAFNIARKMPGGRILPSLVKSTVQSALESKYGPGDWVSGNWDLAVYLNQSLIAGLRLDLAEVQREAASAILSLPHIARVYTLSQMRQGGGGIPDIISQKVANGYHPRRGPDVEFIPDPYWFVSTDLTSHGTPYEYDQHVPVIFMGAAVRPGSYSEPIAVNDIAPTLAYLLGIEAPSGSVGRILSEILVN